MNAPASGLGAAALWLFHSLRPDQDPADYLDFFRALNSGASQ